MRLLVEGTHNSGADNNESLINGVSIESQSDGADYLDQGAGGISSLLQDNHMASNHDLLAFDAETEVTRANNNQIDYESEPAVTGSISAGDVENFLADSTDVGLGTIFNNYAFHALGFGAQATNEEFPFLVETITSSGINSNYCDFEGRDQGTLTLHESLGCGSAHTNTFNGIVNINDGTGQGGTLNALEGTAATAAAGHDILYADSTAHCLEYSANGGSFACIGSGGGTPSLVASMETISSSTTPVFTATTRASINTLTANVTSFTLPAGADGQEKTMIFCQNSTGGFTVAPPANVRGLGTVGATASTCSAEHFTYSVGQTAWLADGAMISNE